MNSKDITRIAVYVLFYIVLLYIGVKILWIIYPPLAFIAIIVFIIKVAQKRRKEKDFEQIIEELDRIEPGLDSSNAYLNEQIQKAEEKQARSSGKIIDLFEKE